MEKSDPDVHQQRTQMGDRPHGRRPTWVSGSDGKMGPHEKNEPNSARLTGDTQV